MNGRRNCARTWSGLRRRGNSWPRRPDCPLHDFPYHTRQALALPIGWVAWQENAF